MSTPEASAQQQRSNRSSGQVLDPNEVFPPREKYHPPSQLATNGSVISMIRFLLEMKGKGVVTESQAISEVSKQIYAKYYHDTVYFLPESTIQRRVQNLWDQFKND